MTYSAIQAKSWALFFILLLLLGTLLAFINANIIPRREISLFSSGPTFALMLSRAISVQWRDSQLSSFTIDRNKGYLMVGKHCLASVADIKTIESYRRPKGLFVRLLHPRNLSEYDLTLTTPKGKYVVLLKDDAESAIAVDWLRRLPQLQPRS